MKGMKNNSEGKKKVKEFSNRIKFFSNMVFIFGILLSYSIADVVHPLYFHHNIPIFAILIGILFTLSGVVGVVLTIVQSEEELDS